MRPSFLILAAALAGAPTFTFAQTFDAGGWTVSASARGSSGKVSVRGSVKGPRCKLLRLDIFTHDREGHRGHVIAQAKDIGTLPRHFSASGHASGRGGRTEVSSVYAQCQAL